MATKVRLRGKPITKGRETLYLEYYPPIRCKMSIKLIQKEYLGIYVYQNPQNETQRDYNQEMWATAEGIRSIRVQSLLNEEFGFLDKQKMKSDFLDYFKKLSMRKHSKWICTYQHFEKLVNGKCTFGEVNVDLCL